MVNIRLEGAPTDEAGRKRMRKALDEQLDKLGIEHAEIDAKLEQGEDQIRIEHAGGPRLGDLGKLTSTRVVHLDLEGASMTPEARAKLDEQLDELGIDRAEIDAKLDAGETHIHVERDKTPLS